MKHIAYGHLGCPVVISAVAVFREILFERVIQGNLAFLDKFHDWYSSKRFCYGTYFICRVERDFVTIIIEKPRAWCKDNFIISRNYQRTSELSFLCLIKKNIYHVLIFLIEIYPYVPVNSLKLRDFILDIGLSLQVFLAGSYSNHHDCRHESGY